ncbi:MAG TPA: glycosyltransferase family 4 protein [bacterium]|nr:glycosyltransferase family 4 protein [bacterium]
MRLAFVRRRIGPFGGGEWFVHEMARCMAGRGHDVHLIGEQCAALPGTTAHTTALPAGGGAQARAFRAFVEEVIRPLEPVIVISGERAVPGDIYRAGDGAHQAWRERHAAATANPLTRFVIQHHPRHQRQIELENKLMAHPRLKAVIANSQLVADDLRRCHSALPADRIRIIYNALDLGPVYDFLAANSVADCRARLGLPADRPVLLFAGSNFQRKGLPALLAALPAIADLQPYLLVAGKGDAAGVQDVARSLPAEIGLRLCGSQPQLAAYYRAADLFILPTLYDPFSNVCLEAMAFAVPVLTTAANGFSELIRRHGVGGVIDEDGPLAGLLRRFLDPATQQACRARICACRAAYDMLPFAIQLEDLLAQLGTPA